MVRQIIKERMRLHLMTANKAKAENDDATVMEAFLRHDECRTILRSLRK